MPIKNFDTELAGLNGEVLKENDKPVLMRTLVVNALVNVPANEKIEGDEKTRRYELAISLNHEGDHDITPEDVVLIKKLVGAGYGPLVVGQIYKVLNA